MMPTGSQLVAEHEADLERFEDTLAAVLFLMAVAGVILLLGALFVLPFLINGWAL